MSDEASLKKMILISILLHLLFLLTPLKVFIKDASEVLADQLKKEQGIDFIFVETPEGLTESESVPPTIFRSDKNLAAANPEAPDNLPEDLPYQEGISEIPAMMPEESSSRPSPPAAEKKPGEESEETVGSTARESGDLAFEALRELQAMSRLAPQKKEDSPPRQARLQPRKESAPSGPTMPRFDSRRTRAPTVGTGIWLSTYNWNWAPYLKELKKRIESNIYPPPAFDYGIINGRTFLHFKILQDGSITEFELIGYTGHESLKNTSVNAIEASVPFLPLPSDFPNDDLELRVGFYYNEFIR